jgi:hypothetical protein
MSLVLMMLAGGQHMSDICEIARDKGLLKLCGIKKVPSPDAAAGFLKKPGNLRRLNFLIECMCKQILHRSTSNNLTIDIDATLMESNKENALWTCSAFTLVALRWENPQPSLFEPEEYCYHIIATNDFNSDDLSIIHDHNRRGNAENYIKEIKNGFGLEYIPTNDIYSNAVYFAIGLLAYNLAIGFKDFLPEEFKKSTIATLRFYLISIPGKVVYHGRLLLLKLQKRFLEFIELIRRRLASSYLST